MSTGTLISPGTGVSLGPKSEMGASSFCQMQLSWRKGSPLSAAALSKTAHTCSSCNQQVDAYLCIVRLYDIEWGFYWCDQHLFHSLMTSDDLQWGYVVHEVWVARFWWGNTLFLHPAHRSDFTYFQLWRHSGRCVYRKVVTENTHCETFSMCRTKQIY